MKVLKFGGAALNVDDHSFENSIEVISDHLAEDEQILIVISAINGSLGKLIEAASLTSDGTDSYDDVLTKLVDDHKRIINKFAAKNTLESTNSKLNKLFNELSDTLHGCSLLQDVSPKALDVILSFGPQLAALVVTEILKPSHSSCEYVDARKIFITDDKFGSAHINEDLTKEAIIKSLSNENKTFIVPGLIGSTINGDTTTFPHCGSGFTAAVIGATLKASKIELWASVDGFLTADPNKVKKALTVEALQYSEAAELASFGTRIIHSAATYYAETANIPIVVKNVLNREHPGSTISRVASSDSPITGVSSISDISLLKVRGLEEVNISELARRLFNVLAKANIEVLLISQSSSNSICVAIPPTHSLSALSIIREEFSSEIKIHTVDEPTLEEDLCIITVVGANMKHVPGISGKFFQTLGTNGISVSTIAQGSSELNISAIISQKNEVKALNAIHDAFFLSNLKTINLFMVGVGQVGSKLLEQITEQTSDLQREKHIDLRVIGLANSRKYLIDGDGINLNSWRSQLQNGTDGSIDSFVTRMKDMNLSNSIFVDCTASESVAQAYEEILNLSISVVTPNKRANAGSHERYKKLAQTAKRANVKFFYETNVGAGLPIIGTLNDLVNSGDEVIRIEAVLSGTLSFIFNSYVPGTSFSEIVKMAREKGYTEPDPRDDLGGMDVARKLLILGREIGIPLEEEHVSIESLVPACCSMDSSVEEFFSQLEKADPEFDKRLQDAIAKDSVLRYIGTIIEGEAKVSLQAVNKEHPFYSLSGSDNIISFVTKRYCECPLVVKGPGAGTDVTAAGVLSDIVRVATYLS